MVKRTRKSREVYVIKCNKNGKQYVGSTAQGYLERCKVHFRLLKARKHSVEELQNDFDENGIGSFSVELIGVFDGDTGYKVEQLLMYLYGTKNIEHGYNYKDKSGISNIEEMLNEIEVLKNTSFLSDKPVEELLNEDYGVFVDGHIKINFEKIKELSEEYGLTINELENVLGLCHGGIRRWKHSIPRADNLYVVADFFGVSMESLLERNIT